VDLALYIKEGDGYKHLLVPLYVVKDLIRDRLSQNEVDRIHRLARGVKVPKQFKANSVVVDFDARIAQCYQVGLNLSDLEPTWSVTHETMTLKNY